MANSKATGIIEEMRGGAAALRELVGSHPEYLRPEEIPFVEDKANMLAEYSARLSEALDEGDGSPTAAKAADGSTSDGYHTFDELYLYRMLYNAAFFNLLARHTGIRVMKSIRHSDGGLCFGGGWFIVVAELPTGQISNHYEMKDWDLFDIPEGTPPEYDGHTPNEAAERLRGFIAGGTR